MKGEAYGLYNCLLEISNRNKKENFLNYDLSYKLLEIKKTLQITMEALEESKVTMQELFSDRELTEYTLPTFTEEEMRKFISGPDELELFEKLVG